LAAGAASQFGIELRALVAEPGVAAQEPGPTPAVELHLAGAMLRIPPGTDAALLTVVLRALRASAS